MNDIHRFQLVNGTLTEDEREELCTHIEVAAEDTALPESELFDICTNFSRMGIDREDIQRLLHPAAEYADRWGMAEPEHISEYLAFVMTGYSFDPSKAEWILETTDMADDPDIGTEAVMVVLRYCVPIAAHIGYPFEKVVEDAVREFDRTPHRPPEEIGHDLNRRYVAAGEVLATVRDES